VSSNPTHVLIVANRTSGTPALLDEVRRRARTGPHRFTLLVPDAPNAKAADWTLDGALPLLTRAAATQVEGLSGGPDPLAAIREAVEHASFDEIIISTLPKRVSKWLRHDLIRRVEGLGLPVMTIVPRMAGDTSIDASLEAGMGAVGRAMSAGQDWAPKGSNVPRIGDKGPRGE
jgi:hypothetical protein